jgi:hypothetical protein
VDLAEKLWIGANHTHSGPARHFPVPSFLAELGGDSWFQPVVDAMVDSIASTVIDSITNLQPAAIAIGLDEAFDTADEITKDRRCQDDPPMYKENRLFERYSNIIPNRILTHSNIQLCDYTAGSLSGRLLLKYR